MTITKIHLTSTPAGTIRLEWGARTYDLLHYEPIGAVLHSSVLRYEGLVAAYERRLSQLKRELDNALVELESGAVREVYSDNAIAVLYGQIAMAGEAVSANLHVALETGAAVRAND